jgi:ribA/ribD-fused uncharacterized protein
MKVVITMEQIALKIEFYKAVGQYGFLSNLFKRPIEFEGRIFPTGEHAYQFGKFRDPEVATWAMTAPKPHLVAVLGHGLFGFDIVSNWAAIKVPRMQAVVLAKFTQHLDLQAQLVATHPAILIETSTMDSFWGCGIKGTGKNMLGKILMETRAQLRITR